MFAQAMVHVQILTLVFVTIARMVMIVLVLYALVLRITILLSVSLTDPVIHQIIALVTPSTQEISVNWPHVLE